MTIVIDLTPGEIHYLQKLIPTTDYADKQVDLFWQAQVPLPRGLTPVSLTKPILKNTLKIIPEINTCSDRIELLINKLEIAGDQNLSDSPKSRKTSKNLTPSKCHRQK